MDNIGVVSLLVIVMLLVLLFSNNLVGVALGVTGLILLIWGARDMFGLAGVVTWNWSSSFNLVAIPLYVFMGEIISRTGTSELLYRGLSPWLATVRGGLLHSNIGACALFAAVSGSSAATAATIGTVAFPALKARGYDERLLLGSLAAGGTLGILIPPSISLIIYGTLVQQSIGRLFMAGVIPGIMLALLFSVYIAVAASIRPHVQPREEPSAWRTRFVGLLQLMPIVLIMVAVLGTIYLGIATPTESAALGVTASTLVALAIGRLSWQAMKESGISAVRTSCMIMFIIAGGQILSVGLSAVGLTRAIPAWVDSLGLSPTLVLLAVVIFYAILGMFMDGISMVVVTIATVYPIITKAGYDAIWFGVILVILSEIGLLTPPVGVNLFVLQGIRRGGSITDVVAGALPFVFVMVLAMVILYFFPGLALWLPSTMKGAG